MIRVTGTLTCATADDLAIVHAHLPEHVRLSRAEPGCLTFNVTQSADPMVWRLDESFTDQAAFAAHQTRTRGSVWFRVSQGLIRDFHVTDDQP